MNSSNDTFSLYQSSGRLSPRTLPAVLLVGIPAALLSGWIYAHALAASHLIPLSMLISVVFSVVFAVMVSMVLTFGHSRSLPFNRISAGAIAVIALWARWITTLLLYHLTQEASTFATASPLGWVQVLSGFFAHLHTAFAEQTSGGWLAIGWVLEALMTVTMAAAISVVAAKDPYSETVRAWARKDFRGELFWPGGNSDALLERLRQQGPAVLLQLLRAAELTASAVASEWWTVSIEGYRVESDPAARWLQVSVVGHTRDNEGKIKSQTTTILNGWQVSGTDYAAVSDHLTHQDETREHADHSLQPGDTPAEERPTAVELMPAVTALKTGNFTSVITLAQAHFQHPGEQIRADAYRLCALAHSRLEQWDQAFKHYHALFEIEPTVFNAMQLATTSVTGGQLLRGNAWFEKADEMNQPSLEMKSPEMRTQFMSALEQVGELAASKPHLDWLAGAYRAAKITDDHLLWTYGLPFFSVFLEKSLPILRACCSEQDVKAWYESMRDDLDEQGGAAVDRHLGALASIP